MPTCFSESQKWKYLSSKTVKCCQVKESVGGMNVIFVGLLKIVEGMNVKWQCAPPHLTTKFLQWMKHAIVDLKRYDKKIKLYVVST